MFMLIFSVMYLKKFEVNEKFVTMVIDTISFFVKSLLRWFKYFLYLNKNNFTIKWGFYIVFNNRII